MSSKYIECQKLNKHTKTNKKDNKYRQNQSKISRKTAISWANEG